MNLIEKFNKSYKNNKNIMKSFEIIDNHIMSLSDDKIENIAEDILDFYDWFCDKLDENEELALVFCDKYGEDGPKIFQIAENFIDEINEMELLDLYEDAPDNIIKNIDMLVNFIANKKEDKVLTLSYFDEEMCSEFLEIPSNIEDEEVREAFEYSLKMFIMKFVFGEGILTFRIIKSKQDIIYGFMAVENTIKDVPLMDLADAYKNNPYDSGHSELYGESHIKFLKY